MNFKRFKIRGVIVLSFALVLTLAIVLTAMSTHGVVRAAGLPAIASDQADYAPGSTVTLTGTNWASGEAVHIYVNDSVGNTWSLDSNPDPVADSNGSFTYQFSLPNTFIANYAVTATGPTSGTATTTFTDAPSANVNLDQFATLPGQGWQNGDLNGNNSAYQEGRVVPFRLAIDGLAGGSHTIHINYDFTAGGHEAYDFLATYNATESANVCSNVSTAPSVLCPVGTPNTLAFPADPFAPGGQTASGKTVDGAIAFSGLSSRLLSMWGGTPLSFTCVPPDGTYTCSGNVAHQAAGSGNSSADIVLTFNTGTCTSNCSVLLAWGGHLAQSAYWTQSSTGPNPGGPNGAGQISGAPFHMRTQQLDGSGNKNQDRSIQPSAIITTLTVNKVLFPSNDPGLFNLLINGTAHATNVGNGGTTGAVTISAGTNSVSETAGTNTSLSSYTSTVSCVDPQGNVVASGSGTSLSVNVISGINVTCTFTNTRKLDLMVTNTAYAGFTRDYNWKITKSVDKTLVEQLGGTATFNYTVLVAQTATSDKGWHVQGVITLTNPNESFDFTGVTVTNVVDNGGTCIVIGGTNVTVPAGTSVMLNYVCSYTSQPAYNVSGTSTSTATWSSSFNTPDTSASSPANFIFNDGSRNNPKAAGNKTVTVTDTFNNTTTTLGTLTATDSSPFTSQSYSYSRTITVPQFGCVTYTNTASLVEAKKSSNRTVKVCGPANTGAMNIGFWQSTNGQSIISGGSSTGGVCDSGTWLQQYAPFQDLSTSATCSDVASYVSNVISAATTSGSSMNAKLKAQLLATALDVYFSDPSLGGNLISAPAPLGGVKIDLHKICQMVDGSGGTATCSGKFSNASSAFSASGATSMTVSNMLAYAANQSNVGGSNWYGNVKATQQLAKDAFDSINNQVAFAP